ncbi:MAG: hypothetical protein ACREBD_27860 [Blastocatellia bacterium]
MDDERASAYTCANQALMRDTAGKPSYSWRGLQSAPASHSRAAQTKVRATILPEFASGIAWYRFGYPNDLAHIWHNIGKKIRRRFSYHKAARKRFPESNLWVWGGCEVGIEKKAERLVCQSCRNTESNWRKKHPGKGIGFDPVISGGSN